MDADRQKHTVAASYLAWTFDAYDFFLLTFVFLPTSPSSLVSSITVVHRGGYLDPGSAGRSAPSSSAVWPQSFRPPAHPQMLDIACYSALNFLIAFTPNIWAFYVACACFGVAMGGVWGICASLSMETIKPAARGIVSGLLQSGYPSGFLISSLVFGFLYASIGWRGMFMVGVIPAALLILYIYMCVPGVR